MSFSVENYSVTIERSQEPSDQVIDTDSDDDWSLRELNLSELSLDEVVAIGETEFDREKVPQRIPSRSAIPGFDSAFIGLQANYPETSLTGVKRQCGKLGLAILEENPRFRFLQTILVPLGNQALSESADATAVIETRIPFYLTQNHPTRYDYNVNWWCYSKFHKYAYFTGMPNSHLASSIFLLAIDTLPLTDWFKDRNTNDIRRFWERIESRIDQVRRGRI